MVGGDDMAPQSIKGWAGSVFLWGEHLGRPRLLLKKSWCLAASLE